MDKLWILKLCTIFIVQLRVLVDFLLKSHPVPFQSSGIPLGHVKTLSKITLSFGPAACQVMVTKIFKHFDTL
jgi:hypothetical protein